VEASLRYELAGQGAFGLGQTGRTFGPQSGNSTFIAWPTLYSLEECDVQNRTGRETFRTNLVFNYAMTERISAGLALSYSHGDNGTNNQTNRALGGSSTETTFYITPSVRYAITQRCAVSVGYNYTDVSGGSNSTASNPLRFKAYTRNRYFAGITYSF